MGIIAVESPLIPQPFIDALKSLGTVKVRDKDKNHLAGASVVVCSSLQPLTASMIECFPETVKLVANAGVGYDHIDLESLKKRGIILSNTPVVTEDTADLAMTLILDTLRKVSMGDRQLRDGHWNYALSGTRVTGKTLGIIGFGNIGQAIAKRASGFDMQILYSGPHRKFDAEQKLAAHYCDDIDELLSKADIVSLNCPLNENTKHIINHSTLAKMKSNAILINTGRGALIDEKDLITALNDGTIAAAGLDVFANEPNVPEAFLKMDNVVLAPHIGSATAECRMDIARCVMSNIQHFLQHGEALTPV